MAAPKRTLSADNWRSWQSESIKSRAVFKVLIAITVMSESAMNSVHAADWMLFRSDDDRETYIDMQRIEVDGSSYSVA
jgi:hypothetical protein